MISYETFRKQSSFSHAELLAFAHGTLIDDAPTGFASRLPTPPMLMIERVVEITADGSRGRIVGERDVNLDDWFYQCHFIGDPVQPGCLALDAVWQLVGFYCCWRGALGSGRALGCGEVAFDGQVRPMDGTVRYEIDIRRYTDLVDSGAAIAIGDARVLVDGECVHTVKHARVGVFRDIAYTDYPHPGAHARGGTISRAGGEQR